MDGQHIFLAAKVPLYDARGRIYGVGAISHDITDHKQAEKALRESERRERASAPRNWRPFSMRYPRPSSSSMTRTAPI